jgi:pseudoazurin
MRLLTTIGLLMAMATSAFAETTLPTEYTVEMWNKDPQDSARKMVFSEDVITVAPGASITWLATDKGHNVQFVDGPDGVELAPKSAVNKDVTFTLTEPGVYVYVCTPHATMGMIGIVIVGEATPEAIAMVTDAKVRGQSKKKFEALLSELD